jgi:hypothetical protein
MNLRQRLASKIRRAASAEALVRHVVSKIESLPRRFDHAIGRLSGKVSGCGCTDDEAELCSRAEWCGCACHVEHWRAQEAKREEDERRMAEAYAAELATPYACDSCSWRGTWGQCGRSGGPNPCDAYAACPQCGNEDGVRAA